MNQRSCAALAPMPSVSIAIVPTTVSPRSADQNSLRAGTRGPTLIADAAFREKIEQYLRYREALTGDADAVSQRDVDRALAELRTSDTRRSAKKGAAPQTEDAVSRAVRDSPDGLTASEVARALGSSRVTAWRYLERLADDHVLERDTEYG